MKKLLKNQSGQGMTEYILIIALIAVAVIAAVKIFGGTLTGGFNAASGAIGTNTGAASGQGVAGAAGAAGAIGNAVGGH
jgi:Flp pilus assembly pilin Flp